MSTRITFGKTAYVSSCGDSMLDSIERCGLPIVMTGVSLVCTGYDELKEFLSDKIDALGKSEFLQDTTLKFLYDALVDIDKTKGPEDVIGDVVFAS